MDSLYEKKRNKLPLLPWEKTTLNIVESIYAAFGTLEETFGGNSDMIDGFDSTSVAFTAPINHPIMNIRFEKIIKNLPTVDFQTWVNQIKDSSPLLMNSKDFDISSIDYLVKKDLLSKYEVRILIEEDDMARYLITSEYSKDEVLCFLGLQKNMSIETEHDIVATLDGLELTTDGLIYENKRYIAKVETQKEQKRGQFQLLKCLMDEQSKEGQREMYVPENVLNFYVKPKKVLQDIYLKINTKLGKSTYKVSNSGTGYKLMKK